MVTPEISISASRDTTDDRVLEVADATDADFIVTGDQDLLTLVQFGRTRIVNAATFLAELG